MKPRNWIALTVLIIGIIAWCIMVITVGASIVDFFPQAPFVQVMWLTVGLMTVMIYLLAGLFWLVFEIERG